MILEFWIWWYGPGWLDVARRVGSRVVAVWNLFSVTILLTTLFSPWRRIISPPGKSIEAIFRGLVDNTVSRVVGFIVRSLTLVTVVILTFLATVIGFAMVTLWPFLPPAAFYFLVRGITG